MGASVGTAPWSLGVALTHQPAHCFFTRQRLPVTCSNLRVSVGSSLTLPRLVAVAAAAQGAQDTSLPSPPPPSAQIAPEEETGPIQLLDDEDPFAIPSSGNSPLQSAASILFTGVLAVFLYRSLRRRIKLTKETKFRSSGLESIKEASKKEPAPIAKPESSGVGATSRPSAFQAFQGAVIAGVIAVILYKFATTVEAGFASKPVSTVYTIRQITITVRTIVNGLCYLATFVFAANSIGLTLYSLQLLFNLEPEKTPKNGVDKVVTDQAPLETESLEEVKKE